jgi:hypothetical protein
MVVLLLTSCAKRIDGSSEEKIKTSIGKVKNSLNDDKKQKFEEAIRVIKLQGLDFSSRIDGKTADEIIAEGEIFKIIQSKREQANSIKNKIQSNRNKKELAKEEIEELYEKQNEADHDRLKLAKFKIKSVEFFEPTIQLTAYNGTDQTITRAYFKGILSSADSAIPLFWGNFNIEIPDSIRPGKELTWRVHPGYEWNDLEAPADAVLKVEVKRLDGIKGEELYSVNNFTEDDQARLTELLTLNPEFKK